MAKHYKDEAQVKNTLKIDSFNHLSTEKIPAFASDLVMMEPEMGKRALGQVPEFTLTVQAVLKVIQSVIDAGLKSNDESIRYFYDIAEKNSEALRKCLEKDDLTEEERTQIIDNLMMLMKMVYDKDTENKTFIKDIVIICVAGLLSVTSIAAGAYALAKRK